MIQKQEQALWSQQTWVQFPSLTLISCLSLSNWLTLSEPQDPWLQNGDHITCLPRLCAKDLAQYLDPGTLISIPSPSCSVFGSPFAERLVGEFRN